MINPKPPTIVEVGKRAGVSAATVSYVLSGKEELVRRIAPDTRRRINDAVVELGYVPNQTARHLRLRRTRRICVLLPKLGTPFVDGIASDVDAVVRPRDYTSIIVTGRTYDDCSAVVAQVDAGLADGIVAEVEHFEPVDVERLFAPLALSGKPVLLLHPLVESSKFSSVRLQRLPAFRAVVQQLIDQGRRRFAYLRHANSYDAERSSALGAMLAENGLPAPRIATGAESRASAIAAATAFLQEEQPPDAILVQSDPSAVAVIHAIARLGLKVPGDVAVVGSGNAEEGEHSFPSLTTIGPVRSSLQEAISHLIDRVEKVEARTRFFEIPWSIVNRESA